jgi:hypothetical protein
MLNVSDPLPIKVTVHQATLSQQLALFQTDFANRPKEKCTPICLPKLLYPATPQEITAAKEELFLQFSIMPEEKDSWRKNAYLTPLTQKSPAPPIWTNAKNISSANIA